MTSSLASSFIGREAAPSQVAVDAKRIARYRQAVAIIAGGEDFPPLAAVNVQPFLAMTPDMLPKGAATAVTSEVAWTFGEPFEAGETLGLKSRIDGYGRRGSREVMDIVTTALRADGAPAITARVALSWPGGPDMDGLPPAAGRVAMPEASPPNEGEWLGVLSRDTVSCLFDGLPHADLNPHVSLDAATRYGLPDLLVSAPQLCCLLAQAALNAGGNLSGLRVRFAKPVIAGEEVAITVRPQPNGDTLALALWTRQPEGARLCVQCVAEAARS